MRLTEHFTLEELTRSDTAKRLGIRNTPPQRAVDGLRVLCRELLEPLRQAWGGAIRVSSGYRCPDLNRAVGGSVSSVHMKGWAADIVPTDGRLSEFKSFVRGWLKETGRPFDQYIDERSLGAEWVHLGLYSNTGDTRRQVKTYSDGRYTTSHL